MTENGMCQRAKPEFHLDKSRELRPWTVRLCETVYDIALNAQHLCETGHIEVDNSRELFASILQWAIEFESLHPGPWNGGKEETDYIVAVDEYAEEKLREQYAKSQPDTLEEMDGCEAGTYDCSTCIIRDGCDRREN